MANVFAALASFTPAASKSRRHIATLAAAFKRIHATVLQQRAARLQQKILAEQAAERAAQDQKLLEEVQQQAAEMRQRMADAQKSFAKSMRKQRKREAKEAKAAKRRGVDWSEWLPLFKVVTSSLGELVASYLQVRPKLAQLKKEGKDPGLKVFLLLEFLQAMEKYLHPERDSAAAPGQPAPAESTSAATVSAATADPGSAPAYGTAQPSPEHASGDRAAAPPTSTPDPESSPPAFQCDALPGFCKMLREMGIFAQAAASPKTPEQTSEAGTQDAPTPSPAEPAQDRAEGGPAARTPAPQISERMSETYPEIISPVSQAVLRPEYSGAASRFAESAEEKNSEAPVQTVAELSEPLLGVHLGDTLLLQNGSPAESAQEELISHRRAGRVMEERMAQARGTRDRQRLATAAESSRLRRGYPTSWSARHVRPVALITIAVLLGLLLGAGTAQHAARRDGSRRVAVLGQPEQRLLAEGFRRHAYVESVPSPTFARGSPARPQSARGKR